MIGAHDPLTLALAAATVAVAGAVRGFAGFGAGLIMMGPLAVFFGLPIAVVAVAVIDSGAAPAMLRGVWEKADRRRALLAAGAAALTLPLGTYILKTEDPLLLRQIGGAGILLFVLLLLRGFQWRRGGLPLAGAMGASAGVLGGATSLIGPPVILYVLARGEAADRSRATLAIYISLVVFSQAIILGVWEAWEGVVGWDAWLAALIGVPIYATGIYVGRRMFNWAPQSFYRRVAMTLLTGAGLMALFG